MAYPLFYPTLFLPRATGSGDGAGLRQREELRWRNGDVEPRLREELRRGRAALSRECAKQRRAGPSSAGAKKQLATPWSWARRLARSRGVRRRRAEARGRGAEQWHRAGDRATTRNSSTVAPGDHDQRFIRGGRAHRDPQISLFRRTRELLRGASPGKKSR